MAELLHAELSYQVRGVLFHVYNALGPSLKEAYYRDAVALGLRKRGITCDVEQGFEVLYEGEHVGLYYVDVWIEHGKILLELKVAPAFAPLHKAQAISYLKVTDADLAILVNYGEKSLKIERLPNFVRHTPPKHFVWRQPPINPELVNTIQRACHQVHFTLGAGFLTQIYPAGRDDRVPSSGSGVRLYQTSAGGIRGTGVRSARCAFDCGRGQNRCRSICPSTHG